MSTDTRSSTSCSRKSAQAPKVHEKEHISHKSTAKTPGNAPRNKEQPTDELPDEQTTYEADAGRDTQQRTRTNHGPSSISHDWAKASATPLAPKAAQHKAGHRSGHVVVAFAQNSSYLLQHTNTNRREGNVPSCRLASLAVQPTLLRRARAGTPRREWGHQNRKPSAPGVPAGRISSCLGAVALL